MSKELTRDFGGYVFDASIPRMSVLASAVRSGKPILQFAPNSQAAQAYRYLAQELISIEQKIKDQQAQNQQV